MCDRCDNRVNRIELSLAVALACALRLYEPQVGEALDKMKTEEKAAVKEYEDQYTDKMDAAAEDCSEGSTERYAALKTKAEEASKAIIHRMEEAHIGFISVVKESKVGAHFFRHVGDITNAPTLGISNLMSRILKIPLPDSPKA